uniref:NACHT domain-containing protein n=1 Tax=Shewanella baltica TaxID=62322 RepID=UPI0040477B6C
MKKVFISYSHKDEVHKDDLDEHLTMLKRSNVISVWHDRKILPAEDWKDQIDTNLENADIIIFLVSSSFLASDYCYDKEVKRAMERQEQGSAQIISVIVRPCDWSNCDFSRFQAVPKDALPITSWSDKDTAWLDAISGIKKHISEFVPKKKLEIVEVGDIKIKPTTSILEWANDTEISLTHRKVSRIQLSSIYVVPDVEYESTNSRGKSVDIINIKNSKTVLDNLSCYILAGEEQQGKTSLLKHFYIELLKKEYLPLYLDAKNISKSDVEINISKAINDQYTNLSYKDFCCKQNRVILLDNIDEIKLNTKYRNIFLETINESFPISILTCHSSFSYVFGDIPELDYHKKANILGLGNKKREEIVKKWISLGVEECIEDVDLYSQCDDLKARLNTVIKNNIVPSKPIYVLMLLQMFEANAQLNLELTSYGHCYQQLIYQSFDKAKINKNDFEKYLNVLTELAWWIFKSEKNPNKKQLDVFFEEYCTKYLGVNSEVVLNKLVSHSILNDNGIDVGFKYPYIYYYFVGKKFAESYSDSSDVKVHVKKLLELIHREDFANILIFITHHTKDSWVLTEIKDVLKKLFNDQEVASLHKEQLSFMDEFMKKIPELILEQREIHQERDKHNQELDEIERNKEPEATEPPDILANINKTFKGMEIAGQIIRNRHASLTRDSLTSLAECGTSSGLRFLEYFIKISDSSKNEIMKIITIHLAEHPNLADKEIEKFAEHAYLHLTYGVINGVIRKIASSVGSKEALEIYHHLEEESDTPAYYLINQAIELQFNKSLKIQSVAKCKEKLKDNPVCTRILKEMVVQHIYMFPVDYKEKQQLSDLLDISIKGQSLMDQRKIGKGA